MADSNEPKKQTVRLRFAQQGAPPAPQVESRDTVRIHLPMRPRASPPSAPADSPASARAATAAMPVPMTTPAPKKETAGITVLPDPLAKPPAQMKKTQPLIDLVATEAPLTTVTVAPRPISWVDQNTDAAFLGVARRVSCDFDSADLELSFQKPWKTQG